MSVSVYYNNYLLYSTTLESLNIVTPKIIQEVNKTGSFTFKIYPDHPYYNMIERFKGVITVFDEGVDEPLFRGRIIKDEAGFYNELNITCEGELAFLLDSIQRPYEFTGTPAQLFTQYIMNHNAQVDEQRQFTVGNITVTDPNDYIIRSNSDYVKTWDEINEKLLKKMGGYLWTRHINGTTYIDYLADFTTLSNQEITFGENLLDLSKTISAETFATAVIALGARDEETGERLTIKSVNNNVDYVYNEDAVEKYGYIFVTNTWDDVTQAYNLKQKAQEYIDNLAQFSASVSVRAADLNGTGVAVNSFRIGRYIKVNSLPHGTFQNFIISKLTRQLDKPEATKLTLGASYQTLTEKQSSTIQSIGNLVTRVEKVEKNISVNRGISGVTEYYLISAFNTGISVQTEGWSTEIPTMTETDRYLWNYEVVNYTDGTDDNTEPVIIGVYGSSGKGIKSIQNFYLATNIASGVTTTTEGWTETVQSVSASKKYLWNYEVVTYTDNTATSTIPCVIGAYGDTGAKGKDAAVQSDTAPADTSYLWLDTSVTPPLLKRHNGTQWEVVNDQSEALLLLEQRVNSNVTQTAENIMTEVSESYYAKDETDSKISEVSTQVEQTAQAVEIRFNDFSQDIDDLSNNTDAQFSEIRKYIRFVDGNIVLGESTNQLTLKIENDKISFYDSNTEVAYFSNNKLYVTDGEFINTLRLGNFAFMPRSNGNLSFTKIV